MRCRRLKSVVSTKLESVAFSVAGQTGRGAEWTGCEGCVGALAEGVPGWHAPRGDAWPSVHGLCTRPLQMAFPASGVSPPPW